MKFVMNGGLIIGTFDGANVEITEEVGDDNIFIFGARVNEIDDLKHKMANTDPQEYLPPQMKKVFNAIHSGCFGDKAVLESLLYPLENKQDRYLLGHDFPSYIEAQ